MKLRPATLAQKQEARYALSALREVRDALKLADCPQALAAVRRAIKSTDGALRHVERRYAQCAHLPPSTAARVLLTPAVKQIDGAQS